MIKHIGIDPKTRKEKVSRKQLLPHPSYEDKKKNKKEIQEVNYNYLIHKSPKGAIFWGFIFSIRQ
ncbi:hypothetical protein NAT51_04170 [Flavobacterium amniphilum]|uniref:hypothetical protein n=1 Tax=Flavobacterium amniphilum TaxID=1834035 RepID=UPI002029E7DD|nr:hypothetical protein [Flavobacterium amniphilum]MCL9804704.1 hypothetical protein [Flavobacterium amniphilum]